MALARWVGRAIGLDVHRDFCVVAICEEGEVRAAGRVPSSPEDLWSGPGSSDTVSTNVRGNSSLRSAQPWAHLSMVPRMSDGAVKIEWAMLADHVVVDQRGKPSIIGIFERLSGTRFPKLYPICFAVARIRGPARERVAVQVRVWSPDRVALAAQEDQVTIGDTGDAMVVAAFSPISLPSPGNYTVEFVPGGGAPHQLQLHVELARIT